MYIPFTCGLIDIFYVTSRNGRKVVPGITRAICVYQNNKVAFTYKTEIVSVNVQVPNIIVGFTYSVSFLTPATPIDYALLYHTTLPFAFWVVFHSSYFDRLVWPENFRYNVTEMQISKH